MLQGKCFKIRNNLVGYGQRQTGPFVYRETVPLALWHPVQCTERRNFITVTACMEYRMMKLTGRWSDVSNVSELWCHSAAAAAADSRWACDGSGTWHCSPLTHLTVALVQIKHLPTRHTQRSQQLKVKAICSSSWETISELRGITCHTGSHSERTQVNAPRHNPSQTGRYSIYLPRRDGRLSRPR